MSVITYYRLCLTLPVLVPLAVTALFWIGAKLSVLGGILAGLLVVPWVFLYPSLLIGGIPYLMLASALLFWMRGKTEKQVRVALLLAPWLMLVVFAACYGLLAMVLIVQASSSEPAAYNLIATMILSAPFIIGIGYFYVWVVDALLRLLKRFRVVHS